VNRTVSRRIERLEARAKGNAATDPESRIIRFIEPVNKRVSSTLTWENGKAVWTHFDPPRDRAEFEPTI
jgi:hypothetical protein